MFSMQRCFKKNQKLIRETSNFLVERIDSIVVFKTDFFFVSLKYEMPNKSISEILESLLRKIFSSVLRILLKKIVPSSEKIEQ